MMLSFFTCISSLLPFGGNKFLELYTGKKNLCKRDGSGGRVFSGCPGCYLGNIRVSPYNRDVAIILLPTECAASFSCSRVYCIWLSGGYIRQRCVVNFNSLNPSIQRLVRLDVKVITCCAPVYLKMKRILSLSFGLMTIPTSFCGHSVFTLNFAFLSIIWLFPSFYL